MIDLLSKFAGFLFSVCIFTILLAFPVMLLWNLLMPDLFGLPYLTFWQSLGLNLLSNILIKSRNYSKNDK